MTSASATTRLASKGQVIIPKALRDAKHWTAGTSLIVEQTAEGILLRPVPLPRKLPAVTALRGIQERIAYQGKAASVEEMQQAITDEAARLGGR